ncbi:odorant receptor 22c-like [Formica exsecta]|uniref:odorant receptor 22c-like n=1 Tax=Formica exsecta TaxID=72781 RepID=UPI0011418C8B|nr:odorant receptor 22c-like [Formica exsecta]
MTKFILKIRYEFKNTLFEEEKGRDRGESLLISPQSSFYASTVMICVKSQHFDLNRILLLAIGLWPYQKSKFSQLQATLCFGILTSFVVFQFTALITTKCTADFIIKIFSSTTFFSLYIIKYNMFWINTHHVRNLLEQLQYICNELKDENELAIFKKYGNYTRCCTVIFTSFAICSAFIATLLPIWPQILGTVLYINESQLQSQTIQIVTEYFVDQQKYIYLIILHTNAVIYIGAITITATGTMILGCVIHTCGLFTIANYRIEQAMRTKILENINLNNRNMICKKIFYAIEIHRKAMKFINFMLSSFEGSFLLLIAICVISLSLNIFAIFCNASLGNKEAFILHLLFVLVIFLYMFIANYAGQEILNYGTHIYSTAYNVRWYNAPLHVQKMILLILQRGSKTFGLNVAGLFAISLECFAMLTKASTSYFTVIYTMQQ